MENITRLDIATENDRIASQGVVFPAAILLADSRFKNWYYLNYMLPVVKFNGINSLSCNIIDAMTYGENNYVNSRIVKISNIHVDILMQVANIVDVLRKEIEKKYYCVLFLDFYDIKGSIVYHNNHYIHELLLYGYDNEKQLFNCYGYMDNKYQNCDLSYEEVEQSFKNSLKYIARTDGWEEYMLITMQKVGHKADYPYDNSVFLDKLENYMNGNLSNIIRYENLLYCDEGKDKIEASGINVTDVFCQYADRMLRQVSYEDFTSQLAAFNIYKYYHECLNDRLKYFSDMNKLNHSLDKYLNAYECNVMESCKKVYLLYLKCIVCIQKQRSVETVFRDMLKLLRQIKKDETEIISGYIDIVKRS